MNHQLTPDIRRHAGTQASVVYSRRRLLFWECLTDIETIPNLRFNWSNADVGLVTEQCPSYCVCVLRNYYVSLFRYNYSLFGYNYIFLYFFPNDHVLRLERTKSYQNNQDNYDSHQFIIINTKKEIKKKLIKYKTT